MSKTILKRNVSCRQLDDNKILKQKLTKQKKLIKHLTNFIEEFVQKYQNVLFNRKKVFDLALVISQFFGHLKKVTLGAQKLDQMINGDKAETKEGFMKQFKNLLKHLDSAIFQEYLDSIKENLSKIGEDKEFVQFCASKGITNKQKKKFEKKGQSQLRQISSPKSMKSNKTSNSKRKNSQSRANSAKRKNQQFCNVILKQNRKAAQKLKKKGKLQLSKQQGNTVKAPKYQQDSKKQPIKVPKHQKDDLNQIMKKLMKTPQQQELSDDSIESQQELDDKSMKTTNDSLKNKKQAELNNQKEKEQKSQLYDIKLIDQFMNIKQKVPESMKKKSEPTQEEIQNNKPKKISPKQESEMKIPFMQMFIKQQNQPKKDKEKRTSGQVKHIFLSNNKQLFQTIYNNHKRGQNLPQFSALLSLIQKEGQRVDTGYKLFNFISDENNNLKKRRQLLLEKAEKIKKSGKIYIDKDFPPQIQSLCSDLDKCEIQSIDQFAWKHYQQIYKNKNPKLFQGQIQPSDIKQGALGDCYFLSSLASLAQYKNLIERLFQYFDIQNGYFLVWLCIDGQWNLVQVDGYLPVFSNIPRPAFSHSQSGQLWVSILQKAYAKCYGSYNNIIGGVPFQATKDLTGSPWQYISFQNKPQNLSKQKYYEQIWQKLVQANRKQYILGAGTKHIQTNNQVNGHSQNISKQGIVYGHAYSILDCRVVDGQKIVQMRNPWGQTQWIGDDWADGGKKWTKQIKQQLKYQQNKNDGIFWIPYKTVPQFFSSISINMINVNNKYKSYQIQKCKEIYIKVSMKQIKNGFIAINQKDKRHKQLSNLQNYQYKPYLCQGFIQINNNVVQMLPYIRFRNKQNFIKIRDMNKSNQKIQQANTIIKISMDNMNINTNANMVISFYGSKVSDIEIIKNQNDQLLSYFTKLAISESNQKEKSQTIKNVNIWQVEYCGYSFICLRNIHNQSLKKILNITQQQPGSIKIFQPHSFKNQFDFKPNQVQCIKLKKLKSNGPGFGISMTSIEK